MFKEDLEKVFEQRSEMAGFGNIYRAVIPGIGSWCTVAVVRKNFVHRNPKASL